MEDLLNGDSVEVLIDEEIVYNLIDNNESGIFSLLLAAGYLKIELSLTSWSFLTEHLNNELIALNCPNIFRLK